ncbi:MAG TPA: addiction module protein [Pyrinomonadaceae bacterium]
MSENFDEILSVPLSLSPGARAMLAGHLLESLDNENQKRIDAILGEEAERRMQEIRDGKVQPIDGEQVMRELRARRERDRESTLIDLLTGVTKTNRHPEVDFGDPVGEEKL